MAANRSPEAGSRVAEEKRPGNQGEAIFLALFVLESQNRPAKPSDQRANLDLQINLLAERESTAALQILSDIARHLKVDTSVSRDRLNDMIKKTDLQRLADEVEVER